MSNFYLSVYDDEKKYYVLDCNNNSLQEFLVYIDELYRDKHLGFDCNYSSLLNSDDDIENVRNIEYQVNPFFSKIFSQIIKDRNLNLRDLGLYLKVVFSEDIPHNYTYDEQCLKLQRLKDTLDDSRDIHYSNKDYIMSELYLMEQLELLKQLTNSEKSMSRSEFSNRVEEFFSLFKISGIKLNRSSKFNHEVAHVNAKVLKHPSLDKVYKKMF